MTAGVAVTGLRLSTSKSQQRLDGVDIASQPGELVAVIGASGVGKSTLLAVLAGLLTPSAGEGTVAGAPVAMPAARRVVRGRGPRIGYVPQHDALHAQLTVGDELRFTAELRGLADPAVRVNDVLVALELDSVGGRRIKDLSGGERQRTAVAVELLSAPDVLLLDEPTSGLDPAHDRDLTRYLRMLADSGCAVVVATHSVNYLDHFDRVLLLGAGGTSLYWGPPREALTAMDAKSYVELFDQRDARPAYQSASVVATGATADDPPDAVASRPAATRRPVRILVRRQGKRLLADHRTLWFLALQAPALGLMVRAMTGHSGLGVGAVTINLYARRVLLTLVLCAVWVGATTAARDIVRDRGVIRRERVAGIGLWPVLGSRLIVLWGLALAQVGVLTVVAAANVPGASLTLLLKLIGALWLCAAASGSIALAISSWARSSDQVLAVLPLVLVPQLILSGGVLALSDVPVLRPVAYLSPARWGLSAEASATQLRVIETSTQVPVPLTPGELHIARHEDADRSWNPDAAAYTGDLAALMLIAAAAAAVSAAGLRRS